MRLPFPIQNIRWILLLTFTFSATITSAQYPDDEVNVNQDRKAKDPFIFCRNIATDVDTKQVKIITLADAAPYRKDFSGMDISGIEIINAVSDSSLLGYVQRRVFDQWVEAVPDKPYTTYLQSYIDQRYQSVYKPGTAKLVWVIQELRIGERGFSMIDKSFLRLRAIAFAGNDVDAFRLISRLDTILTKNSTELTEKHVENISTAMDILLKQSLIRGASAQKSDSPAYTKDMIKENALARYKVPALQQKAHADGIYLTFKEFIHDQPSIPTVTYSLEHNAVRFYYTDSSGNKTFIDKFWGVRKNGILLKQYDDVLIPIEQKQHSIVVINYCLPADGVNATVVVPTMLGGLIGAAIAEAASSRSTLVGKLPVVKNIPYIRKRAPLATSVDIETGEFAL
ncbi:hypothetical protein [Chitinophaga agri]|uniref:Uncharacterized protein n=1 Tax=Chitinophaga agri TaxID=2703787 RepID=A0A6B9Z9V5_9BACT|nr:hypothetical protein [Chitinophaga agri]QHS58796.1 hypothetical protein GWR21_04005 [Chitinophaga agri]